MYTINYAQGYVRWYQCMSAGVIGIVTIFIMLSLYSYHPYDPSWFFYAREHLAIHNICGFLGANCAALLLYIFGGAAFLLIPFLFFVLFLIIKEQSLKTEWERIISCILLFFVGSGLLRVYAVDVMQSLYPGGVVGAMVYTVLIRWLGFVGGSIFLSSLLMVCLLLLFRFSFMPIIHYGVKTIIFVCTKIREYRIVHHIAWLLIIMVRLFIIRPITLCLYFIRSLVDGSALHATGLMIPEDDNDHGAGLAEFYLALQSQQDVSMLGHDTLSQETAPVADSFEQSSLPGEQTDDIDNNNAAVISELDEPVVKEQKIERKSYALPSLDIFIGVDEDHNDEKLTRELELRAHVLEDKLKRFGVSGKVVAIKHGPVVTLFEYQPHIDTKLSKILSLEDDLAMTLKALSIRIIAPIPGRSVVGFEVANKQRKDVMLAHVIQSPEYQYFSGKLPLILGQDTIGKTVIVDLVRMPHLLIAGSTGSGKSVALNAMLMSLLCKLRPDELKLILIDPKRLEFAAYADIAHLLFPIITEPRRVAPILRWVVNEMDERYEKMAEFGARNVADYNERAQKDEHMQPLPLMVIVIDELADLMLTVGRDIEDLITRITQMARAAGIHMIVATQRPSVDVITGLIKANFPSRMSFRVTSRVDSRTIIDCIGADKLLGRGDMLFLDATTSQLKRAHGAYVSDYEIEQTVSHIRAEQKASYLDITKEVIIGGNELSNADDELYQVVLEFLQDIDEVSISLLQRKFHIGYNRSARIIDMLETQGLILPPDGGKTRKVIR